MAVRPVAELDITPALAARLVAEQYPDLAGLPLRLVTSGWDNAVLRLGDDLAIRMPRRARAAQLVLNEQRWLPSLARVLAGAGHVGLPLPARIGVPSSEYPWAWSIVPWFAGRSAVTMSPHDRAPLAEPLADALARLHVPAPDDAPVNAVRGVPLATRDAAVRERLATGLIPDADRLAALWDTLSSTPSWPGPPLWLHGDVHPGNLVVDDHGLRALVDFGDVTSGDPATDLATAWLTFDAEGRRRFRHRMDALRGHDDDTWRRARGWALCMGTSLAAHSDDSPEYAELGSHTLRQVLKG
ncbi:aminoglycoside phosphotransferase family protein [Cellulomonas timonensis]|uniref:aminoglycoside phosphotransferase family protein n=1 Tax=Cellulomonas timonensis TaxID=1689271 RepID=UPI0008309F0F|nr:aminoglycoside phosphotransferase family protein [Cellulomonas timonensis]